MKTCSKESGRKLFGDFKASVIRANLRDDLRIRDETTERTWQVLGGRESHGSFADALSNFF